jgi:hypothetical protein
MAEDLFEKFFSKSINNFGIKRVREDNPTLKKTKRIKKLKTKINQNEQKYIQFRVKDEHTQTSHIYFFRYDLNNNINILKKFIENINKSDLSDLIIIEEFDLDITIFTKEQLRVIKDFCDINPDLFSYFYIKEGPLSGKINNEIQKRETDYNIQADETNDESMEEWLQRILADKSFVDLL